MNCKIYFAKKIFYISMISQKLIGMCTKQLKHEQYGLKSDHFIHGCYKLYFMLSILFKTMLVHGWNPSDVLCSTIVSIPKDPKVHLTTVIIIEVYHYQTQTIYLQWSTSRIITPLLCVQLYIWKLLIII